MIPVKSSTLEGYEYDPETRILTIKFRSSDHEYDYFDVSESAIKEFEDAESKGRHFHTSIKNKYQSTKREAEA